MLDSGLTTNITKTANGMCNAEQDTGSVKVRSKNTCKITMKGVLPLNDVELGTPVDMEFIMVPNLQKCWEKSH